jgi:sterol desaturase/sphingolipid hydroxylase (fatty acid hydroxylase superfamily)
LGTITQSLCNRLGHTRIEGEHPILDNFHVNHHAKHVRNFGFSTLPLDLLMGTECGDVSRLDVIGGTRCAKLTEGKAYVLDIRPVEPEGEALRLDIPA